MLPRKMTEDKDPVTGKMTGNIGCDRGKDPVTGKMTGNLRCDRGKDPVTMDFPGLSSV